jgi:hypothetical protein
VAAHRGSDSRWGDGDRSENYARARAPRQVPCPNRGCPRPAGLGERRGRHLAQGHHPRPLRRLPLTADVHRRIAAALEEAGLIAKPPIEAVERFETVRLALDEDRDGRPDEPQEGTRSRTMSRAPPDRRRDRGDRVVAAGDAPERKTVFSMRRAVGPACAGSTST